jgi:hypothetical protein
MRAVIPEESRHSVQNFIQVSEAAKHSSQSLGFPGVVNRGTREVQHGSINVNGVWLKLSIEAPKADPHAKFALGEVLLKMPNQVGDRCCRVQHSLELVPQGDDKLRCDRLPVGPVQMDDQAAELLLEGAASGMRHSARPNHVRNNGDIAL